MACEARILRVLRTLGYPGLEKEDRSTATNTSLLNSPDECARIVSWIEDRKVKMLNRSGRRSLPGATEDAIPDATEKLLAFLCPFVSPATRRKT